MQNNTEKLLVEMRDIVKTFPGTKALDGVTLKLRKGEIHALVGENGAGKSTLMNILTGQFAMDSGEVIMEGEPVRFSSPREAMRKNIVLVPQELNLVPEASIAENIFLGNEVMEKKLINWTKTRQEAERLLALLDVHVDVSQPVKVLSAAYQQLVSIARALAYDPKVLILDEPTRGIDIGTKIDIQKLVLKLASEGMSVTFISSETDEMLRTCSRLIVMRDRKVVGELSDKELSQSMIMNTIAGGEK